MRPTSKRFLSHLKSACVALSFTVCLCAESAEIRVNQTDHPLDAYAVGAIRVALKHMPGYTLKVTTDQITQARAIEYLETDQMDLMWLASNQEVEDQLLPIRFPLLKGLLGHRVFIINPQEQSRFSQVRNFDDMRSLKFGQGAGWPDVEILKSNGLQVVTTSKYNNLFYMVEGGRFDGFPRGVLEPWVELAARRELGLTVENHVVLIYKLPFYLFVAKNNQLLANKIQNALDTALADGGFDEYFYGHEMVKDALSRSKLKDRLAFHITNPFLSKETPLDKSNYWLDLNEL
ncbi:hypothetical protein P886_3984 [Alteromonadaceae bacterium 2753L.S.0a.02]|nr:hypothetical protein P886_3984 [Alteromonadaceae bacterium 2753L.S.0a.02]